MSTPMKVMLAPPSHRGRSTSRGSNIANIMVPSRPSTLGLSCSFIKEPGSRFEARCRPTDHLASWPKGIQHETVALSLPWTSQPWLVMNEKFWPALSSMFRADIFNRRALSRASSEPGCVRMSSAAAGCTAASLSTPASTATRASGSVRAPPAVSLAAMMGIAAFGAFRACGAAAPGTRSKTTFSATLGLPSLRTKARPSSTPALSCQAAGKPSGSCHVQSARSKSCTPLPRRSPSQSSGPSMYDGCSSSSK
mmetsp:Transcript_99477/g.301995  ORF Transcript_99477/g.301995 Transcript_99477/m.301995 type:complete len:252 (+) Transcript_99477:438-1193(+)